MVAARSGAAWRRPALMGHGAGSGARSRIQKDWWNQQDKASPYSDL